MLSSGAIPRCLVVLAIALLAACEYLPISGGRLEGTVAPLPADIGTIASADIIQLETAGESGPYSVNLWIADVGGTLHVFAGDNRTAWVENIEERTPDVRLGVGDTVYELRAERVTDGVVFYAFARAWESKYGNPPRNQDVDETWLFRLLPRA